MEAIRKKIKRNGSDTVMVKLPEDFKTENLELIILPDEEEIKTKEEKKETIEEYRQRMREFYDKFNVDLSDFKFN